MNNLIMLLIGIVVASVAGLATLISPGQPAANTIEMELAKA